jgi:hypothetical protein
MDIPLSMQELISCPKIVQKDDLNILFFDSTWIFGERNPAKWRGNTSGFHGPPMSIAKKTPADVGM